jgi:hypothetical protein
MLTDDSPIDGPTTSVINDHARIFDLLHQGNVTGSTEWGIGDGSDVHRMMPQIGDVKMLANLAILKGRWRYSVQDSATGEETFLDAMALGRNIAHGKPITMVEMVQSAIEQNVLKHWAKVLPSTLTDKLALLPDRLAQLTPPATSSEIMAAEMQNDTGQSKLPPDILKGLTPLYDAAAREMDENPTPSADQFKKDMLDEVSVLPNPTCRAMGKVLAPSLAAAGSNVASERTYLEMFKTGIKVIQSGADAVKTSVDPAGSGPFEYSKTPNGFELRSKLVVAGEAVKLEFGE